MVTEKAPSAFSFVKVGLRVYKLSFLWFPLFHRSLTLFFILKMGKTTRAGAWCVSTGEEWEWTTRACRPWSALFVNSSKLDCARQGLARVPQPCCSCLPAFSSGWPVRWHCGRRWTLTFADFIGIFFFLFCSVFSSFLRIIGNASICPVFLFWYDIDCFMLLELLVLRNM